MSNLSGGGGVLNMTIQVKRAATGETETHELVGTISPEQENQIEQLLKEKDDGNNALDSGA